MLRVQCERFSCVYFWSFHRRTHTQTHACMCTKCYDPKWHEFVFYAIRGAGCSNELADFKAR
jgi:hypothetical protein